MSIRKHRKGGRGEASREDRVKELRHGLRLNAPPTLVVGNKRKDAKAVRRELRNNRWRDDAGGCSRLTFRCRRPSECVSHNPRMCARLMFPVPIMPTSKVSFFQPPVIQRSTVQGDSLAYAA